MKNAFWAFFLLGGSLSPLLAQTDPAQTNTAPSLPNVLLIGGGISASYTSPVRQLLNGKANVRRIPDDGGTTANGLTHLDAWLGQEKWDVIYFNFGLEDAAARVDRAVYEDNLRQIVKRLQLTGARLIWASTPAAPSAQNGEAIPAYNALAARIMAEYAVPIDDLYGLMLLRQQELQRSGATPYTPEIGQLLGESVAAAVSEQLPPPARP